MSSLKSYNGYEQIELPLMQVKQKLFFLAKKIEKFSKHLNFSLSRQKVNPVKETK